ncbi:MAG: hypothetical protein D6767_01095 [Candidatus Hydrogenedentota bacterium]|nr:MAG: hypothetical protein D6767_01095 [Candidatus Hydrogenedentota bacterium]
MVFLLVFFLVSSFVFSQDKISSVPPKAKNFSAIEQERKKQELLRWNFAFNLFQNHNYNQAFIEFQDFLEIYPNSRFAADAYLHMGEILEDKQFYFKALDLYKKGKEKYPAKAKEFQQKIAAIENMFEMNALSNEHSSSNNPVVVLSGSKDNVH